jgi:hypothetical protein
MVISECWELTELAVNADEYVHADLPRADCGGVRRARLDAEVEIVNIANTVGLVLSVLVALLLGAAP